MVRIIIYTIRNILGHLDDKMDPVVSPKSFNSGINRFNNITKKNTNNFNL